MLRKGIRVLGLVLLVAAAGRSQADVRGEEMLQAKAALVPSDIAWTTGAPMPTSRARLAVGVVGDKIYAIGGWTWYNSLSTVEEYDTETRLWTAKSPMPTARGGLAVGVVGGKVYAIGGYYYDKANHNNHYLTTVEEYDPIADVWTTKAPMPTGRAYLAAGVVGGKIYAIGGWDGRNRLDAVEEYDPATDSWTTKAQMPTGRYYLAAGAVGDKVYAIGGWNGSFLTAVEEYDPTTDRWTVKAPMSTGREGLAAGVMGGKIYVVGGWNGICCLAAVEEYDPASDRWEAKAPMSTGRVRLAVGVVGDKIYAVGGYSDNYLATMEEGALLPLDSLPIASVVLDQETIR
jgi:N-acetylneuraminic acid mutarotase